MLLLIENNSTRAINCQVSYSCARNDVQSGEPPPAQKYNTRYTIAQTYINVRYKKTPVT